MVDITHKSNSLRTATAQAIVNTGSPETIRAVLERTVPKGDVFEVARTAGLFAVKNTANAIPDCHPMPVEFTAVTFETTENAIQIDVTVKTIYKTGVEVEAMHGAAIVALTIYDMLKPIDKQVEIGTIKLTQKKGGKSDFISGDDSQLSAAVIVCSDSVSAGTKEDTSGKIIVRKLKELGIQITKYSVIPDQFDLIQSNIQLHSHQKTNLVILTGGTGLSHKDVTPEAVIPLLDRRIPGIEEAIRSYGRERTPYAMLSRSVAGFKGDTLVLALPGSATGAAESIEAIFPAVLHVFKVLYGDGHGR